MDDNILFVSPDEIENACLQKLKEFFIPQEDLVVQIRKAEVMSIQDLE